MKVMNAQRRALIYVVECSLRYWPFTYHSDLPRQILQRRKFLSVLMKDPKAPLEAFHLIWL